MLPEAGRKLPFCAPDACVSHENLLPPPLKPGMIEGQNGISGPE